MTTITISRIGTQGGAALALGFDRKPLRGKCTLDRNPTGASKKGKLCTEQYWCYLRPAIFSTPLTADTCIKTDTSLYLEFFMRILMVPCLLLGCILSTGCGQAQADDPMPEVAKAALEILKTHVGKDLKTLDKSQVKDFQETITKLVPKRNYDELYSIIPWRMWEFQKKDKDAIYVLFEAQRTISHPGSTHILITTVDKAGKVLSETTLSTGHRCYLHGAKLEKWDDGEYPMLKLETGLGGGPGPNIRTQYYAYVGGQFTVVRLEDSNGNVSRNKYYIRHFTCGPAIPAQTEAQWEADLLSDDRMKELRALVWLGGAHLVVRPVSDNPEQYEDSREIKLIGKLRTNKKVLAP